MRYPGQSFGPNDDWPAASMTSYTATTDYGSKSAGFGGKNQSAFGNSF
jgi:hypothetical protein